MGNFFQPNTEALDADYAKDKREVAEMDEVRPFKLEQGVTEVRILPPFNERGTWYREIKEYFFDNDGQFNRITSPSSFGLPDPVAEKRQQLIDAGGEANLELAKELREQRSFLYNVIIKSAPAGVEFVPGKVYVLKSGVKVKRSLLNHDRDGQGGWADITNPDAGVTFRITRSGKGFKTDYQVQTLPMRTTLAQDCAAAGMAPIGAENLYNLDALYPPLPEDEIRMRLLGMNPRQSTFYNQPQAPQFQPVPQGIANAPAPQPQPQGTAGAVPQQAAPSTCAPVYSAPAPQAQPVPQAQAQAQAQAPQAPQYQPVPQAQAQAPQYQPVPQTPAPQPMVQPSQAQPVEQAPLPEVPAPPPADPSTF